MKIYQTIRAGLVLVIVVLLPTPIFSAAAAAAAAAPAGRTLREFMASSNFNHHEVISVTSADSYKIDLSNKNLIDLEGIEPLFIICREINQSRTSTVSAWSPPIRIHIDASGNNISSLPKAVLDGCVEGIELKGNPLTDETLTSFSFLFTGFVEMIFTHKNASEIINKLKTKALQLAMYKRSVALEKWKTSGRLSKEAFDDVIACIESDNVTIARIVEGYDATSARKIGLDTLSPKQRALYEEICLVKDKYSIDLDRFNRNKRLIFRFEELKKLDRRLPLEALVSISAFAGDKIPPYLNWKALARIAHESFAGHKRPRGT